MQTIKIPGLLPTLLVTMSCGHCGDDAPMDDSAPHSESDSGRKDADQDGFPTGQDCNDSNAKVYPGAEEICDGLDNNCNELIDDIPPQTDLCDAVDNDCDGFVDEDEIAVFESDSGEVVNWSEDLLSATANEPLRLTLEDAGELRVCGGERRYLMLDILASVSLIPANSSIDVEISGGDAQATVLKIVGDSLVTVTIEGVTIRDGVGDCEISGLGGTVGGGICCVGAALLELRDVVLGPNYTEGPTSMGGGMFTYGCSVAMEQTRVVENYAGGAGGGVYLYSGSMDIMESSFLGNECVTSGGAAIGLSSVWDGTIDVPAEMVMENSVVKGNLTGYAVAIEGKSSFECIGDSSGEYGIVQNSSERGAVYMHFASM